jgi:hypothetical protein
MRENRENPDNSVVGSKHRLQERPGCTAGKNNRGKVVEGDLTKICFSLFLSSTPH